MRRAMPWFGYLVNGITLGITGPLVLTADNGLARTVGLMAFCGAVISLSIARAVAHRATSQDPQ